MMNERPLRSILKLLYRFAVFYVVLGLALGVFYRGYNAFGASRAHVSFGRTVFIILMLLEHQGTLTAF